MIASTLYCKQIMHITALLPTHDLSEEAMPWMEEARNIFDELTIFIDEKRVTPGTVTRAEKVGTRVHRHNARTWYEWDLASMARACESDWVFLIERDEQLSPEWQQSQWRQILETTQFTHFWVPRRWMVSKERYIISNPWCLDFQLRLFRNNLDGTTFPTKLHDTIHVPGSGGCFRNLAMNHHVLWLCSRATRESRVRHYEQLRPGEAAGHYYLFEDYTPREANLPTPVVLNPTREILPMVKLSPEEIGKILLEVRSVPEAVGASELFWVDVKVTNATPETLHSRPPCSPVYLSYHWLDQATRHMFVWDGSRSGFHPDAPANTTTSCTMMIAAPDQPGRFLLQISIVQEEVCWFDQVRPGILQEFDVLVTAG
jgi:hypothetical protein